mmetsp:Transcript_19319/g.44021  ORF Transcript_19319/g.44021 Transcript_19319/m.44021 type:complete len:333 (-) Transcript_19319:319-1317(-)
MISPQEEVEYGATRAHVLPAEKDLNAAATGIEYSDITTGVIDPPGGIELGDPRKEDMSVHNNPRSVLSWMLGGIREVDGTDVWILFFLALASRYFWIVHLNHRTKRWRDERQSKRSRESGLTTSLEEKLRSARAIQQERLIMNANEAVMEQEKKKKAHQIELYAKVQKSCTVQDKSTGLVGMRLGGKGMSGVRRVVDASLQAAEMRMQGNLESRSDEVQFEEVGTEDVQVALVGAEVAEDQKLKARAAKKGIKGHKKASGTSSEAAKKRRLMYLKKKKEEEEEAEMKRKMEEFGPGWERHEGGSAMGYNAMDPNASSGRGYRAKNHNVKRGG